MDPIRQRLYPMQLPYSPPRERDSRKLRYKEDQAHHQLPKNALHGDSRRPVYYCVNIDSRRQERGYGRKYIVMSCRGTPFFVDC